MIARDVRMPRGLHPHEGYHTVVLLSMPLHCIDFIAKRAVRSNGSVTLALLFTWHNITTKLLLQRTQFYKMTSFLWPQP
jgi:hypothetical protein